MKPIILFSALATAGILSAQQSQIDTVFIDHQLKNTEKTGKIQKITSQDLLRNATSLSDVLMFQTPVYIKENGRGMVSSPAFRGTTAQQTAFLWNGINVNSQFLGQGDINNLSILSYDHIDVKYGGGSVIYGSGAIGGSIHLNNSVVYGQGFSNKLFAEYGSFNTLNTFYKGSYSNDKFSANVSVNHSNSANDYEVSERYYHNLNGRYENTSFNLGLGYKLSDNQELYAQSQRFDAEQHYPILSEFATKTKYDNQNFRSLLGWKWRSAKFKNDLKIAFLQDEFQYFDALDRPKSSGGLTTQYVVKNDWSYPVSKKGEFNFISEYNFTKGEGYGSGISELHRNQGSLGLLYRHQQTEKFFWELGLKKDFVERIASPFLYSAGAQLTANNWYQVKLSFSKNFRFPSFNDLYWQPGGNLDLKPETSHQLEMTHQLQYKDWKLTVSPYYIAIRDMIRWLPVNPNFWTPVNTSKVRSFGVEAQLQFNKKMGDFGFNSNLIYAYTNSQNQDTKRQLMYVPKHKSTFNAKLAYQKFNVFFQAMYNGKTFVDSEENDKTALNSYVILNAGVNYQVFKLLEIGVKVNNITDQIYLTTEAYYMPKRNYAAHILLNF